MFSSNALSKHITKKLSQRNIIDTQHCPIYEYCISYLLELIIFFFTLEIISIVLGRPMEGILFFLIVVPLRSLCGGFHATSRGKCTILSYSCYLVAHFVSQMLINTETLYWVILFTLTVLFLLFAPSVIHKNRHFNSEQKKKNKHFRYLFLLLTCLIFAITYYSQQIYYFHMTVICVSIVVANMLIAMIISNVKGGYSYDF